MNQNVLSPKLRHGRVHKAGHKAMLTFDSGVKSYIVTTLVNWFFLAAPSGAIEQYLRVAMFINMLYIHTFVYFSFFSLGEILNKTIQMQCEM